MSTDVTIVRDARGVYEIKASGTAPLSMPDIMAIHMDPGGAGFFRDIGKYDRVTVENNGELLKAEWNVESKKIVLLKSRTPEGIEFWTGEGSDLHMEGTWTFHADGPQTTRIVLSQKMGLDVPPFVPGFFVRRILKQKIRRVFEDMEKINKSRLYDEGFCDQHG
jgi:hypothetical protein